MLKIFLQEAGLNTSPPPLSPALLMNNFQDTKAGPLSLRGHDDLIAPPNGDIFLRFHAIQHAETLLVQ